MSKKPQSNNLKPPKNNKPYVTPHNNGLPETDACRVCKKKTKKLCSGCKIARYCSTACAKIDWGKKGAPGGHRIECKAIQKSREKMNKDDLKQPDGKGHVGKRTSAICCTAVSIDLRKVFTAQELSGNPGINWITVLLTRRNHNTLGLSVMGMSSHCNASAVLYTVGQFLTESTKVAAASGLDVGTVTMEAKLMDRIRDDKINNWFLQTGSPQAVQACVKLTTKHLKKLKPKPGCGRS